MAKRDDEEERWRRRREREKEREEEELQQEIARNGGPIVSNKSSLTEQMDELIRRAEPLIDQCNGLYNQFMCGVESRPPIERRKQLDQTMDLLQTMGKAPVAAYIFRYRALLASYFAHRERWDKLLRDLEAGKIRRLKPKRRAG